MLIIGLTGSIGMGKSETARMFAAEGVPVFDADAAVHALYAEGGAAVGPIGARFPGTVKEGRVDRAALGAAVLGDKTALQALEAIIHPLVRASQQAWLAARAAEGAEMVVLDIPLLFETGAAGRFDAVVVVSAPADLQRARVLARPGMTAEKFEAILAKQMPDAEKRARADFVVPTDQGLAAAAQSVRGIIAALRGRHPKIWTERPAGSHNVDLPS